MRFSSIKTLGYVAGTALLLVVCGCSDMLTYSQDSKRAGIREYNDGKYADAAGSFRNAIRQNATDPESEYWLGVCYEQTKDYHEAIVAYKTALDLMPTTRSVEFNAQMHESAFDRLAHVVAAIDANGTETDLILKDSTTSDQFRLVGRIFRYRGDADTAIEEYHHAIDISPTNFVAQKELGIYLEQLNQNQQAGQVLRDAYRLNSNDAEVNAALRQIGMVPGPGLLPQDKLTKPMFPAIGTPVSAAQTSSPTPVDPPSHD